MSDANLTNFHYAYMDLIRHWQPDSEKYTGGDALYTALADGWQVGDTIRYEECWLLGGRFVVVYYFDLKHDNETMTMPVVTNPYVSRLISTLNVKIVALAEKKIKPVIKR